VVLRSLEKSPEQRYQHASEIKTEVEGIVQSPGKRAASPGPRYDATVGLPMALLFGAYIMLSIVSVFTGLFVVIPGGIVILVSSFTVLNFVWLIRRSWAQPRTAATKTEPSPPVPHALWPRLATIAVCLLACIAGLAPPVAMVYYQDYWHPISGCLGMLLGAFALAAGGLAPKRRGVIVLTTGLVIGIGFIAVVVGPFYGIDWPPIDLYRSGATRFIFGLDHSHGIHWQFCLGPMACIALIALGVVEMLPTRPLKPNSVSAPTAHGEPAP
jgi:hypothetical protein